MKQKMKQASKVCFIVILKRSLKDAAKNLEMDEILRYPPKMNQQLADAQDDKYRVFRQYHEIAQIF